MGHPAALAAASRDDVDQQERSRYIQLFLLEGKAERVLAEDDYRRLRAMFSDSVPKSVVDGFVRSLSRPGRLTAALNYYRANLSAGPAAWGRLANIGDRLVFSNGIVALGLISSFIIAVFGGHTDYLIPLYAVGVFLSFTLSQAGMVQHWRRVGGPGARSPADRPDGSTRHPGRPRIRRATRFRWICEVPPMTLCARL